MAKKIQNQKEEERVVSKSWPAVMGMSSYFIATSTSAASSPIATKSPVMPIASGRPIAGWVLNQAHSTQRRRLKCDLRMHTLAGWLNSSGETRPIKKKKIQKTQTILQLEPGTTKENLLPKTIKLGGNPLHKEPVLQLTRKVKRIRKRHGTTTFKYRRTHRTVWIWPFGECSWIPLFKQQFISEKTMTRIYTTRETISGTLWNNYLDIKKDWFVNYQKFLVQEHQRSLVWK